MHINRAICDSKRPPAAVAAVQPRHAFTLVELMVVIVIIGILASLTLAGLSGVRQRAKIEKTKSTIRKIDAVIRPMYDSYRFRRVVMPPGLERGVGALQLLKSKRAMIVREMPDCWGDVPDLQKGELEELPQWLQTAAVRSYAMVKQSLSRRTNGYGSAECLYLIVTRSGFEPDAMEAFRDTEVGDIDKDGAPEFWDAWGRPIAFIRWAPGFTNYSTIQSGDPLTSHDPLDPMQKDPNGFSLIPLIYSPGPDESLNDPNSGDSSSGYGLVGLDQDQGWNQQSLDSICSQMDSEGKGLIGSPDPSNPLAHRDNITNHDLLKK